MLPKQPSTKGPAEMFTGDVWLDVIAKGEAPSRMRVNTVRFSPGARTAWHAHAVGQTLHVIEGIGLIQSRGGDVVEIRPGQTIHTPPDEWHWHGAAPDHFMAHLAMWEAPGDGPESSWGDHVTDEVRGSWTRHGRGPPPAPPLLSRAPAAPPAPMCGRGAAAARSAHLRLRLVRRVPGLAVRSGRRAGPRRRRAARPCGPSRPPRPQPLPMPAGSLLGLPDAGLAAAARSHDPRHRPRRARAGPHRHRCRLGHRPARLPHLASSSPSPPDLDPYELTAAQLRQFALGTRCRRVRATLCAGASFADGTFGSPTSAAGRDGGPRHSRALADLSASSPAAGARRGMATSTGCRACPDHGAADLRLSWPAGATRRAVRRSTPASSWRRPIEPRSVWPRG